MEDGAISIWMIVVIGGPLVLGAVLAYGVLRARWRRRQAARGQGPAEPRTEAIRERERHGA